MLLIFALSAGLACNALNDLRHGCLLHADISTREPSHPEPRQVRVRWICPVPHVTGHWDQAVQLDHLLIVHEGFGGHPRACLIVCFEQVPPLHSRCRYCNCFTLQLSPQGDQVVQSDQDWSKSHFSIMHGFFSIVRPKIMYI